MIYCINETLDEPIMLINSHIGMCEEDGMGVDGALFQQELLYLDSLGKKRIQIWINSIGGVVIDGFNIISAILKSKTPVDTYNVGMSVSIAGVIFMCGRNRVSMDYSLFMAHSPNGGNDDEVLKLMQGSLATVLSAKCDLTVEQMSDLMTKTTWLDSNEMLDMGLSTEVETTDSNNKKRVKQATDKQQELRLITNKLITTKNKKSMLKVTNKLGLNDDANEENILNAIKEIENKSASEKEAMAKQIEEAKNALKEMEDKYNALEIELESEKEAQKEKEATNMVKNFADVGRIANNEEAIAKWTNLAKADFQGTKELIEGLPLNAIANKIDIIENVEVSKSPEDFMHQAMKEITNKTKK